MLFYLILKIEFIVNFRLPWIAFQTFTNMKAFVVMCLLFVSCYADDYPTTKPDNIHVEHDDGGHDNNQYETDDSMQLIGDGGYTGISFGGLGGGKGGVG